MRTFATIRKLARESAISDGALLALAREIAETHALRAVEDLLPWQAERLAFQLAAIKMLDSFTLSPADRDWLGKASALATA